MPLGELERRILQTLAGNRHPDSYIGGGTVINRAPQSPRFSKDVDLFHDTAESVAQSAQADFVTLNSHGFQVRWLLNQPTFQRAEVAEGSQRLRLEWVFDSAFRFFPVEKDPELGYRLNFWDAATNKVLALAGRSEPRDFIDVIYLNEHHLSLAALCWAAAGKDEGLNPVFILEEARRASRYTQSQIDSLQLAEPLKVPELKRRWLAAVQAAESLLLKLPPEEVGCLYLGANGTPVTPDPSATEFTKLTRHKGSIRGAWPRVG